MHVSYRMQRLAARRQGRRKRILPGGGEDYSQCRQLISACRLQLHSFHTWIRTIAKAISIASAHGVVHGHMVGWWLCGVADAENNFNSIFRKKYGYRACASVQTARSLIFVLIFVCSLYRYEVSYFGQTIQYNPYAIITVSCAWQAHGKIHTDFFSFLF
jgi:hypothetical protein